MKDPRRADSHQHFGPGGTEPMANGDAVVAGIEHEERDLSVRRQQAYEALHLVDGGGCCIHGRCDALGVERGGPAARRPVQLADPLMGPPTTMG